jgi:hypothetical protein
MIANTYNYINMLSCNDKISYDKIENIKNII